jgi:hypothetical protein
MKLSGDFLARHSVCCMYQVIGAVSIYSNVNPSSQLLRLLLRLGVALAAWPCWLYGTTGHPQIDSVCN